MKKKVYTAFICLCCAVVSLFAQERVVELTNPNESCTSIAAGKLATTDGSVMTSQRIRTKAVRVSLPANWRRLMVRS